MRLSFKLKSFKFASAGNPASVVNPHDAHDSVFKFSHLAKSSPSTVADLNFSSKYIVTTFSGVVPISAHHFSIAYSNRRRRAVVAVSQTIAPIVSSSSFPLLRRRASRPRASIVRASTVASSRASVLAPRVFARPFSRRSDRRRLASNHHRLARASPSLVARVASPRARVSRLASRRVASRTASIARSLVDARRVGAARVSAGREATRCVAAASRAASRASPSSRRARW
jgi:hypothetical protein|tara:strand:- start:20563 stop:21249 length:687 start_codon:yes stop_codon:yes gene_type:complete